jgi:hypothetical protein
MIGIGRDHFGREPNPSSLAGRVRPWTSATLRTGTFAREKAHGHFWAAG